MLLRHSEKDIRHRGEYKTHSNNVEAFDSAGQSLGIVFETTTPFDTPPQMRDLMTWTRETLADNSYHPLIVASIFNVIFLALQRTQKTLKQNTIDWLPWLRFFMTSLKRQKDHLIVKTEMAAQYSTLPYESMLIMQYVDSRHRITIRDAEQLITSVSRPTIKNRLSALVEQGLLVRQGKARGTRYSKPQ